MESTQVVVPQRNCSTGRTMTSITMFPQHRIPSGGDFSIGSSPFRAQQMHRAALACVRKAPLPMLLDQNLAELPRSRGGRGRKYVVDAAALHIADRRPAQLFLRP